MGKAGKKKKGHKRLPLSQHKKSNGEQSTQENMAPGEPRALFSFGSFGSCEIHWDRASLLWAGGLLAAGLLLFLLVPGLIWEEKPTGVLPLFGYDTAYYALLLLASAGLFLVSIQFPTWMLRGLRVVALLLLPIPFFYGMERINGTWYQDFTLWVKLGNYLCCLAVIALVYALTRRVWITALVGGALLLIFAVANYFTVQFRGTPILPWDLQSVGTAAAVLDSYEMKLTREMCGAILTGVLVIQLARCLCPMPAEKESRVYSISERGAALVVSCGLFFLLLPVDVLSNLEISVWAWNQKVSMQMTGVSAGFFANLQFVMVEKPASYGGERVEALGEELEQLETLPALGNPEKTPTIVAVMNESLTDMGESARGAYTLTPDNLSYIHSLENSGQVIYGTGYSSVFGGNTCNSEYEFLTGNTTAFLPVGSKPFQQYVTDPQTSLLSVLKEQKGYRTVAVHPGRPTAWSRDKAYPNLGFDEFVDAYSFDTSRDLLRGYTTDESSYEQVIYEYEHKTEEPLFLFNVTIQNHGGFEDKNYASTIALKTAAGELQNEEYPQAAQYLSLVKNSDEAFEDLISYFEKQQDPVLVLLFGDHWPTLEDKFMEGLLGGPPEELPLETTLRQYEVPFLLWANYPLEGQEIPRLSLNYLSGLLLRAADLELSPYQNYLEHLRQQVPVITAMGAIDSNGITYENGGESPLGTFLEDYRVLQYNQSFDEKGKLDRLFAPASS